MIKTILLTIVLIILSGCASKNVVYEKVYIPTKCDIEMPTKPDLTNETFIPNKIKNMLIYTESLESALRFCIKL